MQHRPIIDLFCFSFVFVSKKVHNMSHLTASRLLPLSCVHVIPKLQPSIEALNFSLEGERVTRARGAGGFWLHPLGLIIWAWNLKGQPE